MLTIVVVDDRITNRNILARLASTLEGEIAVEAFDTPAGALEWVASNTPDLVITDFKMPGMNGGEFVRRFRKLPHCFDVPVVVVTVYEDQNFRYTALEAGATDFLLSPVDHTEFRARMQNLLTLRRQQQTIKNRIASLEQQLKSTSQQFDQVVAEGEEKLRAVIDTVPAMISAIDNDFRFVFVNRSLSDFYGVSPVILNGLRPEEITGREVDETARNYNRTVFETGETLSDIQSVVADRDGTGRTILSTKAPLCRPDGTIENVVTVSVDITDRGKALQDLSNAKNAAQVANLAKSEFLSNMSHELRTPLNAVIGFSEVMSTELLGPIGSPRYLEYANDIQDSAQHLLSIIQNILDTSEIESGSFTLNEGECDIALLVGQVARIGKKDAERIGATLTTNVAADLPIILADKERLRQVMFYLMANALKFLRHDGDIELFATHSADGGVQLGVIDTGIGMTEDELPVALSEFGQVDSSHTRQYQGAGLGLSLSISLIEMHSGHVHIESEKDKGTKVTAFLPPERVLSQSNAQGA